jgi:hypothetical protein
LRPRRRVLFAPRPMAHPRPVKLPSGYYLVWGGQFENPAVSGRPR